MSSTHAPIRTTPKMQVPGPRFPWKRISLAVLFMAVLAAAWWLTYFFQTHTTINMGLAGAPISFATRPEVEKVAAEKAQKVAVTFKSDSKTVTPMLEQIGVKVNQEASVKTAFEGRRLADAPDSLALWKTYNVPLAIDINRNQLETYIAATFPDEYKAPQQPNLTFSKASGQFELVPGEPGRGFDIAAIVEQIKAQAENPQAITVQASNRPVDPSITDAAAVHTQDEANQRLWLRLDFLYQQELIYYPEPPEIASWMEFTPSRDGSSLDIHYNREKIQAFLRQKVEPSLNRFFGPGSGNPEESESPLKIAEPWALITDVVDALSSKRSVSKEVKAIETSGPDDIQQ